MERKLMLLVNPNAGKGGYRSVLGGVLERFCAAGWTPTVYFTRHAGHAPELVAEHGMEYERIACMGGDGTLSEVCAGMMRLPERRPIGYIPLGTTNDVAHTLGLSPRPVDAAAQAAGETPISFDVGRFNANDYFTYVAAFGAFTEVSYATPQEAKQALGHLAYTLEGIRSLGTIRPYHCMLEHDVAVVEDDFIFGAVTNSTTVAGLVKLRDDMVSLDDGEFEVLLVKTPRDLVELGNIVGAVLNADFSGPLVSFFKCGSIRFRFSEPVAWTLDGENGGEHDDVTVRCCHPGVKIMI
jgi:YegS/Rv2252/BmrU family lipid kinase